MVEDRGDGNADEELAQCVEGEGFAFATPGSGAGRGDHSVEDVAFRASVDGFQGFIRLGDDESPVVGRITVCVKDADLWRSEPSWTEEAELHLNLKKAALSHESCILVFRKKQSADKGADKGADV